MPQCTRVYCKRTLFLAHVGCQDITVILEGTMGTLVKTWGLRSTIREAIKDLPDDGYIDIPPGRMADIMPIVCWDSAVVINAMEDADIDGEFEGEGRVVYDREVTSGIPWNAIYVVNTETWEDDDASDR